MKKTIVENEDWKLGCFIDWQPKNHEETCTCCNGNKEVGGGFKSLDGTRQCPECYGRGTVTRKPKTNPPELPNDLIEHMRRAWWDFLNSK